MADAAVYVSDGVGQFVCSPVFAGDSIVREYSGRTHPAGGIVGIYCFVQELYGGILFDSGDDFDELAGNLCCIPAGVYFYVFDGNLYWFCDQ